MQSNSLSPGDRGAARYNPNAGEVKRNLAEMWLRSQVHLAKLMMFRVARCTICVSVYGSRGFDFTVINWWTSEVFEDSVTDPSIEIHDLKTLAPSGVFLASALTENDGSSRTCLRALEPYTWINESLSTQHFGQTDQILGTLRSHVIDMTIPRMRARFSSHKICFDSDSFCGDC